jgi:hypothetical protein
LNLISLKRLFIKKGTILISFFLICTGAFLYYDRPFAVNIYTHIERTNYKKYRYIYKWGLWQLFCDGKLMCRGFSFDSNNTTTELEELIMKVEEIDGLGTDIFVFENQ